jgi:hypothetical protein
MTNCSLNRRLRSFSVHFCWIAVFVAVLLTITHGGPSVTKAQNSDPPDASSAAAESQSKSGAASAASGAQQPIPYSHRLHAGELRIDCVYCHYGARRSAVAGVPAVGVCTGCHRWVKHKTAEMKKVDEYEQKKQPIVWKRINHLDDYVYFSHKRHLTAGLECQGCHGQVEKMDQVQPIEKMTMGWCVTCHEQRNAPLDCSTCHR